MDTITTIQSLLKLNGSAQPVTVSLTESERHLIAAAPDMYEALENILISIATNNWVKASTGRQILLADAKAAIKKARGESK